MSSRSPSSAIRNPAETGFVAALAAGLPASLDWTFPSLVAVSGGADSVALLLGLLRLAPAAARPRLVVAHADHGLRAEAAEDREFVRALAEAHGLRCIARRLEGAGDRDGEGLEGRARRLRYGFLVDAAHEVGARHVMVAHTADDQAETVLHRILRGTGLAGLAGMRRSRTLADGVALLRPLLNVPRAATRAFLEHVGQEWREDATNADTARARNFLRHEVLPRCVAGPYPAADEAIARLSVQAATAADALASAAEHLLERHAERHADGIVVLRTRGLAGLDAHLVAEIFAALWRREGWSRRDMTAGHFNALVQRATDSGRPAIELPDGIHAWTEVPGMLHLCRGTVRNARGSSPDSPPSGETSRA